MKNFRKIILLVLACALVCTALTACGSSSSKETAKPASAKPLGTYHFERIEPSTYGPRIQRGLQQNLTLFDDGTYSLSTLTVTWRSSDYEAGAEFVAYSQFILNVYGTYEVTGQTEGDEADNPTKTVSLKAVTRADLGCDHNDAPLEGFDYIGDSATFDSDLQAKALSYFNVQSDSVTLDLLNYKMNQGVSINLPIGLVKTDGSVEMFM